MSVRRLHADDLPIEARALLPDLQRELDLAANTESRAIMTDEEYRALWTLDDGPEFLRGRPGPRRDQAAYEMVRRVAVRFRRAGLPVTKYHDGPLAMTLAAMLRALKPGRPDCRDDGNHPHENVRRYLAYAVEASAQDPHLADEWDTLPPPERK